MEFRMLITLNTLLGKILSVGFVGCVIQLGFRTFVLTLLEGKEGVFDYLVCLFVVWRSFFLNAKLCVAIQLSM